MPTMNRNSEHGNGVALVTGSRRGIGLGIALELAKEGFAVVLNGTAPEEDSREALGEIRAVTDECLYIQADISKTGDHGRILAEIRERFGRLNILVNNAGVAPLVRKDILEAGEESFDRLWRINLRGPYFLTRDAANWMIEQQRERPREKFKIINISSLNAYTASPSRGEYCITKAALGMMTALYAARLAEYGIGVFEIRPGIIKTDMTQVVREKYDDLISGGLLPLARWGLPRDIGRAVAAIGRDYFPYSTGEVINVDGGFHLKEL